MAASGPMQLALAAAREARGRTSPNPWVGAVVVRDRRVVATGATEPPGGRHAEAVALDAAGDAARDSDLYVTLEPCGPFPGKRTQPCAERIAAAGLARVFVAMEDPDPNVDGGSIASLRAQGIDVRVGGGSDEATALLRPYIKHRRTGMPYVIAKWASSLDGRIATASGDSRWITGEAARARVHEERAWVDAILTGSGTVLADDPELTARPGGTLAARQPVRVILDARGRTPPTARTLQRPGTVIVATTAASDPAWRTAIAAAGAQVIEAEPSERGVNLRQVLQSLGARGVLSVWTEAGGTLLGSLFDEDLVDEAWAFIAPLVIGGDNARPAVGGEGAAAISSAWRLFEPAIEHIGDDVLVRGFTRATV